MLDDDANALRSALGIRPKARVWLGGHDLAGKRIIEPLLTETARPPTGPIDIAFLAPESADEAAYFLVKIEARLVRDAVAWVILAADAPANDLSVRSIQAALARCSSEPSRPAVAQPVTLAGGFLAHPLRQR